jgi:hypothetical protein
MTEHDTRKKFCPYAAALNLGNVEVLVPRLVRRGVSVLDFVAAIVVSAALLLLASPAWAQSFTLPQFPQFPRLLSPSPAASPSTAPPPPTLTLTFNPQMPSVQDTVPLSTVIATVTAAWSNGSPFTGTLMFGSPYADDGGTFALSCQSCATANIVVSPNGLGLMGDGGTVQQITVVATQ